MFGLTFWVGPHLAAVFFQLEATGLSGDVALRAQFGGLFVGLSLLCVAGLLTT
ncbi:MAG: hypothetical protein AB7I50_19185 [Vicinamibacterales bacterium]